MLYRRLLGALLSDYDFSLLWAVLGLDTSALLSPAFAAQVVPLLGEPVLSLSLDGLAALWAVRVRELGIARVHPTLTLVYRAQTARAKRKRAEPEPAQDPALEAAVAASLRDVGLDSSAAVVQGLVTVIAGLGGSGTPAAGSAKADTGPAKADRTPVQAEAGPVQTDASLAWALPPQRMEGVVPDARTVAGPSTEGALPPSGIIGTKAFAHDDTFLDAHVARTLAYWYGQRAPEGVPVELSRRCL
jgi:exonuclease V